MVVEADESDGSFNRLPATIAIVTNIDPEHMEHWGSFDALRKGFQDFVSNIPFYGLAVCCIDHPEVQARYPLLASAILAGAHVIRGEGEPRKREETADLIVDVGLGSHGQAVEAIHRQLRRHWRSRRAQENQP